MKELLRLNFPLKTEDEIAKWILAEAQKLRLKQGEYVKMRMAELYSKERG